MSERYHRSRVEAEPLRIEICPNCSLTVSGARVFFGIACIAPCGIAAILALKGFWPVLPFAGLEMALLGWALSAGLQRRFHSQTITVTEADVSIDTRVRASSAASSRKRSDADWRCDCSA
jgi:uncharacterized membrane protein